MATRAEDCAVGRTHLGRVRDRATKRRLTRRCVSRSQTTVGVFHWVGTHHSSITDFTTFPARYGHDARVTFMAQPLLCLVIPVERYSYVDIVGDVRDPTGNPNYAHIALSRNFRLEGVAESMLLRKIFDAWNGEARERTADKMTVKGSSTCTGDVQGKRENRENFELIIVVRSNRASWRALEAQAPNGRRKDTSGCIAYSSRVDGATDQIQDQVDAGDESEMSPIRVGGGFRFSLVANSCTTFASGDEYLC